MVILAAAAITAAGVGVYKGGKAAAADVGKKLRRRGQAKERKETDAELQQMRQDEREQQQARTESMSTEDRLKRFKRGVGASERKSQPERKGLFGRNK